MSALHYQQKLASSSYDTTQLPNFYLQICHTQTCQQIKTNISLKQDSLGALYDRSPFCNVVACPGLLPTDLVIRLGQTVHSVWFYGHLSHAITYSFTLSLTECQPMASTLLAPTICFQTSLSLIVICGSPGSSPTYSFREFINVKAGLPWLVFPCAGCYMIALAVISSLHL